MFIILCWLRSVLFCVLLTWMVNLCLFRLPDDFDKPEFATVNIQRDLFYGYDTLMENVSDPSHIEFAHHKVQIIPFN